MKITIIYDNNAKKGLKSDWGFSCLVEDSKKVLFDTGADSGILLYNMKRLKINPKDIDIVVLSHNHLDHIGGLKGFLKANNNKAKVYYPTDFSEPTKITRDVYSTGALSSNFLGIKEQSLFVKTPRGLVILVGCSHPGVDKILDTVKKVNNLESNKGIYAIIGGFHGFNRLEKLRGIELIGACHCTQYKKEIKDMYPANYKEVKAGSIIGI